MVFDVSIGLEFVFCLASPSPKTTRTNKQKQKEEGCHQHVFFWLPPLIKGVDARVPVPPGFATESNSNRIEIGIYALQKERKKGQ